MEAQSAKGADVRAWVEDADLSIYVGDALDVLRSLPDRSVDAVVTSPPYADARIDYTHVGPDDYAEWLGPIAAELLRVVTPEGGFMLRKRHDGARCSSSRPPLHRHRTEPRVRAPR